MKKILALLLLAITLAACSGNDPKTDPDPEPGSTIDNKLLGKWKVEYSKTIKPARYNPETGQIQYGKDPVTTEYFGDFDGYINTLPKTGMFDEKEVWIEILKDNKIKAYATDPSSSTNPIGTCSYKIENGYLKGQNTTTNPIFLIKYYFEGKVLVMEYIGIEDPILLADRYVISKYSKIE